MGAFSVITVITHNGGRKEAWGRTKIHINTHLATLEYSAFLYIMQGFLCPSDHTAGPKSA